MTEKLNEIGKAIKLLEDEGFTYHITKNESVWISKGIDPINSEIVTKAWTDLDCNLDGDNICFKSKGFIDLAVSDAFFIPIPREQLRELYEFFYNNTKQEVYTLMLDELEKECNHIYSRSMDQTYPRKCILCKEVEKKTSKV